MDGQSLITLSMLILVLIGFVVGLPVGYLVGKWKVSRDIKKKCLDEPFKEFLEDTSRMYLVASARAMARMNELLKEKGIFDDFPRSSGETSEPEA